MCGNHKISSTKLDFATSLGGTRLFEHENMHAQLTAPKEDLLFCYPADKRRKPGVISSMYPAYRQLSHVLKDTICQKTGDYSAIPGHMVTIMRLAHHDALRLIDGIDFFGKRYTKESLRDGRLLMLLIFTGSSCLLLESIGLILCLDGS
jgi:hypothetical protein